MWTVRGCELSEETCQRKWTARGCELSEDVNWQGIWTLRGCELSEDVNCQKRTLTGCQILYVNDACQKYSIQTESWPYLAIWVHI